MNTPYPFQLIGADFLAANKRALLADEMGLGKTVQAILAADKLKAKKILIVCPAIAKYTWKREFEKWGVKQKIEVVSGTKHTVDKTSNILIVNYDLIFRPRIFSQITAQIYAVGVFDEAHYLKNAESKRTQAAFVKGGIASRCFYKWFLTGTPVLNRPVELYPLLKAVAPDIIHPHKSFSAFAKQWCGGYWDGVVMHAEGATNIEDLNKRLTTTGFMLRRLKAQVIKDLPERQYQIIPIESSGRLPAKFMSWSKQDAKWANTEVNGSELAIFRHELAKEKIKYVVQHAKEILEEKQKLVIFAYHRDVVGILQKELTEYAPVSILGGVNAEDRDRFIQRFQHDPDCRVFIGQIQAAGTNITLTAADTILFAEISWVPGEIFQAADRVHRIGQKNKVLIQFVVVQDSVEEFMLRTVIEKKITIEKIVEEQPESEEFQEFVDIFS